MKYLIILLLTFASLLYSKSSDYSIIIDKPFNDVLFDITQDYDRDLSAVGFSREYKKTASQSTTYKNAFDYLASVSNTQGSQITLIKADDYANITLNKKLKLSRFNEAVAVVKTPTNGYFIGG